jgi:hypothetical protein
MSPFYIALLVYLSVALSSALFLGAVFAFGSASDRAWDGLEKAPDDLESLLAARAVEAA